MSRPTLVVLVISLVFFLGGCSDDTPLSPQQADTQLTGVWHLGVESVEVKGPCSSGLTSIERQAIEDSEERVAIWVEPGTRYLRIIPMAQQSHSAMALERLIWTEVMRGSLQGPYDFNTEMVVDMGDLGGLVRNIGGKLEGETLHIRDFVKINVGNTSCDVVLTRKGKRQTPPASEQQAQNNWGAFVFLEETTCPLPHISPGAPTVVPRDDRGLPERPGLGWYAGPWRLDVLNEDVVFGPLSTSNAPSTVQRAFGPLIGPGPLANQFEVGKRVQAPSGHFVELNVRGQVRNGLLRGEDHLTFRTSSLRCDAEFVWYGDWRTDLSFPPPDTLNNNVAQSTGEPEAGIRSGPYTPASLLSQATPLPRSFIEKVLNQ